MTTPGSIVDGLLVTGSIIVEAPNVTIRNTRVAPAHSVYWVIRQAPGATNFVVEDSELVGGGVHIGVNQEADTLTVRRSDISGVDTAVSLNGNHGTVQDNYLHDVPTGVGAGTRGSTIAITHNTILSTVPGEAAIGFADRNTLTGVTVEDNLLAGGNYTFYGGGGAGLTQQITVRGNHFSRSVAPDGGRYGPVAAWTDTSTTVWTGNVWDDTGAVLRA